MTIMLAGVLIGLGFSTDAEAQCATSTAAFSTDSDTSVREGESVNNIFVTFTPPVSCSFDMDYAVTGHPTASNGATLPADVEQLTGMTTVPVGTSRLTIPFSPRAFVDDRNEMDEVFLIQLQTDYSVTHILGWDRDVVAISSFVWDHQVTLRNAPWALSIADATVEEGNSGESTEMTFTASLNAVPFSQGTLTVDYATMDGSAMAGSDYVAASGTLTFGANDTERTFTVQVTGDDGFEPDERFTVALSNANKSYLTLPPGATGTIENDDARPQPQQQPPRLSIADAAPVQEGNAGDTAEMTFRVSLDRTTSQAVTVDYATEDGDATAGSDYVAASGTLSFAPGERDKTVTVQVTGDDVFEPDERFAVALSNARNATLVDREATGTIENDDERPRLSIADAAPVQEGNAGDTAEMTFRVSLNRATFQAVTVDYATEDGDATAGSDYVAASGTLSFAPGERDKTVTVQVIGDDVFEPDERFAVALSNARNATLADREATGTIENDDERPRLSIADAAPVQEGNAGDTAEMTFRVSLDRTTFQTVTVDYATEDGDATAGSDYVAASGTLSFAPGERDKTVTVQVIGDDVFEPDERFAVALSNARNAALADREATGTIVEDDAVSHAVRGWLSRFGRTVAGQAVDAVSERLERQPLGSGPEGRSLSSHLTLGGQRVELTATGEARDRDAWMRGEEPAASWRTMPGHELMLGSSFHVASQGEARGPAFAAWGRVMADDFDADMEGLRLDGEVTTGFLGADVASGPWLTGAAVLLSEGEGAFGPTGHAAANSVPARGAVDARLTSVLPYARLTVNERVSVWGFAGYGTGELKLTEKGAEKENRYATDIAMTLGALGVRRALMAPSDAHGFALALEGDAFWVRTESDARRSDAGDLGAMQEDASRLRLMLDALRAFETRGGATLTPSLEVGVRYDGGDAETGFGVDVGGGVALSGRGLMVEIRGRGLLAHEAGGFHEWGAGVSLDYDAAPSSERGLSLTLRQDWSASASGGADALLSRQTMAELAANDAAASGGRLVAEARYGIGIPGGPGVVTPYTAAMFGGGGGERAVRAGVRWTLRPSVDLGLEGTLREAANDDDAEHGMMLRGSFRW